MTTACPNCKTAGMRTFYDVRQTPAHSCLMMTDEASARGYPRRDLALGFCDACGFIANVVYDASVQAYSAGYEDQQSFSPRFRAFQTELIDRWVSKYGLRDKTVLEIGCSKGDFLIELCERGGNRGIGVDPSCVPGRVKPGSDVQVKFIADYYAEKHSHLACDAIVCRHTMEHIPQTNAFVKTLRNTIGDRQDIMVFIEVPDVYRVLTERAFWDIYYEHCSYFSLGSLARVFRANGFEVTELARDYGDQYLLLVARPAVGPTSPHLKEEDDLDALREAVASFEVGVRKRLNGLREQVQRATSDGRRAAVWGSGSKCVSFLSTLGIDGAGASGSGGRIDAIVDINPHRHGKFLAGSGHQVVAPETLKERKPDVVFIMNPIYRDEIAAQLEHMGVEAELVAI